MALISSRTLIQAHAIFLFVLAVYLTKSPEVITESDVVLLLGEATNIVGRFFFLCVCQADNQLGCLPDLFPSTVTLCRVRTSPNCRCRRRPHRGQQGASNQRDPGHSGCGAGKSDTAKRVCDSSGHAVHGNLVSIGGVAVLSLLRCVVLHLPEQTGGMGIWRSYGT